MQAIIFIGIQATGKSTFYVSNFLQTHVRISLDLLRTRHREKEFLSTCIRTGQDFVIDNTNITVSDRKRYFDALKDSQYEIIGYYFESKIQPALCRNDQRSEKQRIPVRGVLGTYTRLQVPSYKEGFQKLYYVAIKEDGNFNVQEWKDEI